MFGINPNWELLTPRGFRFYLPGSVGPAWLDATTTAQTKTQFVELCDGEKLINSLKDKNEYRTKVGDWKTIRPMLDCVAQECPILLRKSIEELFSGCLDVTSSHLTIITISQRANPKSMRWHKEAETEKLAKYVSYMSHDDIERRVNKVQKYQGRRKVTQVCYLFFFILFYQFVLAASDICTKLKMVGYWADFINPFSGQPYLSPRKDGSLYETDERFRCLGFKVEQRNNCRIIASDSSPKNFIGTYAQTPVTYAAHASITRI